MFVCILRSFKLIKTEEKKEEKQGKKTVTINVCLFEPFCVWILNNDKPQPVTHCSLLLFYSYNSKDTSP